MQCISLLLLLHWALTCSCSPVRRVSFGQQPHQEATTTSNGWKRDREPYVRRVVSDTQLRSHYRSSFGIKRSGLESQFTTLMMHGDFGEAKALVHLFVRCPDFAEDPTVGQRLADLATQFNQMDIFQDLVLSGVELRPDQMEAWSFVDAIPGLNMYTICKPVDAALMMGRSPVQIIKETLQVYPHTYRMYEAVRDCILEYMSLSQDDRLALDALDQEYLRNIHSDKLAEALQRNHFGPSELRLVRNYIDSGRDIYELMNAASWVVRSNIVMLVKDEETPLGLDHEQNEQFNLWMQENLTPGALAEAYKKMKSQAEPILIRTVLRNGHDPLEVYTAVTQAHPFMESSFAKKLIETAGDIISDEDRQILEAAQTAAEQKAVEARSSYISHLSAKISSPFSSFFLDQW